MNFEPLAKFNLFISSANMCLAPWSQIKDESYPVCTQLARPFGEVANNTEGTKYEP